jgi:hypothetical protein
MDFQLPQSHQQQQQIVLRLPPTLAEIIKVALASQGTSFEVRPQGIRRLVKQYNSANDRSA